MQIKNSDNLIITLLCFHVNNISTKVVISLALMKDMEQCYFVTKLMHACVHVAMLVRLSIFLCLSSSPIEDPCTPVSLK
jgi:hypothetical protein